MKAGRIEHGGDRIDLGELAVDDPEAGRSVHPRVGRHDENAGEDAADRDHHPRQPVQEAEAGGLGRKGTRR